ncbi:hypothetical protein C1645_828921 [Glomus cerebriforme]|uniref:F-box domain-containing protein n=1 Tax=Glomus cerebriforme TaxID=658196 RepID=A0A397SKN4_9GLOM|nr:hypothetical protein C1645_828921 [Glomus cerebriforme]
MACSKIFTGDLPEISTYIIQNLRNDIKSLYSCILVNRFLCRLAIPLLWEDPFSIKYQENLSCHFIDIYFLLLNENDKNEIKNIKYSKFDSYLHKPLFNYPSLIKTLNLYRMKLHIVNWLNSTSYNTALISNSNQKSSYNPLTLINHLQNDSYEEGLQLVRANEKVQIQPINIICIILFKLFIENNASLNNLYISINVYSQNKPFHDIYYMIINNPKFISKLSLFSFEFYNWPTLKQNTVQNIESLQTFLSSISSLCTCIKHINFYYKCTDDIEFEKNLANIIQSQLQLSSVKIGFPMNLLSKVPLFDSLKYSSNTLTSIHFNSCIFSDSMKFDALSYLTKLESLQFKNCSGLKSKVIQPLLNINTPLKIKTFVIFDTKIEEIIPIQLLIQKIGSYIEILILSVRNDDFRKKLFDTIINFCDKIYFLHLNHIDFMNISQLSQMILIFNNYLKYLIIEIKFYEPNHFSINTNYNIDHENDYKKVSSMILKELNNLLPYYLDLNLVINPNDLKFVFDNCNQVKLKKLLIRNRSTNDLDIILNIIKEFSKEKNLEFFSYGIGNILSIEDQVRHKNLELLIEETQSFVKMKRYDDLVVKISDIDGNLL